MWERAELRTGAYGRLVAASVYLMSLFYIQSISSVLKSANFWDNQNFWSHENVIGRKSSQNTVFLTHLYIEINKYKHRSLSTFWKTLLHMIFW